MKLRTILLVISFSLGGCIPTYQLVPAKPTYITTKKFTVAPSGVWNRVPPVLSQTRWEQVWTKNGPLLDSVSIVSGLPDGKAVIVQLKKADRQVPAFRVDMTPQDLVSMIEATYRVKGVTVFNTESVDPIDFLDGKGLLVRYNYAPGNGITKKGACVLRVVDKKLYAVKLDGVASHYYDAVLPEFEQLVATAALQK